MSKVNYIDFHKTKVADYDAIVVGCGFTGATVAEQLANRGNKRVLIIEKRSHIGGNMYDETNKDGVLIHNYGPHIFHTSIPRVAGYIVNFSKMRPYEHRVKANWYGTYFPVPFNKTSMEIAFGKERANELIHKLIQKFGDEVKVTINELREQNDKDLSKLADFVYENVFLHYTMKQWGVTPEEVDPTVTARVPVFISRDDRYFQDTTQFMPIDGYTPLFENMLSSDNIDVALNIEAESVFGLHFEGPAQEDKLEYITVQYKKFDGPIIFTGPLDELFLWRFGRLPYRSLDFKFETKDEEYVLPCGTVNYTVNEDYTRITEFKHLTGQKCKNTTIMKEYSRDYEDVKNQIPYYAIINKKNNKLHAQYMNLVGGTHNFYAIGRLAEYKYYNMDQIIDRALSLSDELLEN
ncbi:MAG: UDP-galactopyranose mutase [Coriobacteriia bacterium]|nr:UDP-galactopyranose mutase [Coriobacteriia bacterium]